MGDSNPINNVNVSQPPSSSPAPAAASHIDIIPNMSDDGAAQRQKIFPAKSTNRPNADDK